jgi:hypothetical protein
MIARTLQLTSKRHNRVRAATVVGPWVVSAIASALGASSGYIGN